MRTISNRLLMWSNTSVLPSSKVSDLDRPISNIFKIGLDWTGFGPQ